MNENICYKCRKPGHFARECTNGTGGGVERDRNNNTSNTRMFRDSNRSNGGQASSSRCFKCNRTGHWARDCRESSDRCYKCNKPGHLAKDCENNVEAGSCYNCGQVGHLQRDCKLATVKTCYKCRESGHLAKDCPNGSTADSSGDTRGGTLDLSYNDGRTCYNCGKPGHISRDCPESGLNRKQPQQSQQPPQPQQEEPVNN